MNDNPDFVAWFVVETDVEADRDEPVYTSISGPFPTEEKAEQERDGRVEAWERALGDWGENPYDHKRFDVTDIRISDWQLDQLEREDRESYEIRQKAAGALGEALLADTDAHDEGDT